MLVEAELDDVRLQCLLYSNAPVVDLKLSERFSGPRTHQMHIQNFGESQNCM